VLIGNNVLIGKGCADVLIKTIATKGIHPQDLRDKMNVSVSEHLNPIAIGTHQHISTSAHQHIEKLAHQIISLPIAIGF
jgi:hypothetical protein